MTTQVKQPQSIFPDFPRGQKPFVDDKGHLDETWDLSLNSLYQGLQTNFSNEGILFPQLDATDIATIQAIYTPLIGSPLPQNIPDISGKTIFDTTNKIPKQFIITYDSSTPPKIQAASWLQFTMIVTFPGNPNGNIAGAKNWICFDTVDIALFICTTPGSANGLTGPQAIWTGINGANDCFLLL